LEAIGNVLIYLVRNGFLPWMSAEIPKKDEKDKEMSLLIAH
jgi:hypothetical protein